jgi:hypothetical protein
VSARRAVAVCGVGLFAAFLELHYGRLGYMPLDQSVVFDGGWRTLTGQVPFRDYTTPNAITPSLLQGLFFWLLGVSWTAYLVHAAVFNALFAVLVYLLLRLCGAGWPTASIYAALSAVVFYPPFGVPFHDQHAFFFVLLAIVLAVAARSPGRSVGWQRVLWACVPFALVAAALAKQTPAALGVPVVLVLALAPWSGARVALSSLAIGTAASMVLLVTTSILAGVEWRLAWVYLFDLPLSTGRARTDIESTASVPEVMAVLVVAGMVLLVSLLAQRLRGERPRLLRSVVEPLGLAVALLLLCVSFISLTFNEPVEGIPYLFASIGLLQVAVCAALPDWRVAGRVSLALPASVAIAILAVAIAWTFNADVNATRSANNIEYDHARVQAGAPAALSSMEFQVPRRYAGLRAAGLTAVAAALASAPGNFVLIGDTTILNALAGKPSVFPSLFLTTGLTVPPGGSPELERFEARLLERIRAMDVRRVVLERRTWETVTLANFPRFEAFVKRCRGEVREIGFFELIELDTRPGCASA